MKKIILTNFLLVVIMVTPLAGCITIEKKEFNSLSFFKSDEYSRTSIHRVLLVPFAYETKREKVVKEVTEAFFIEFQKSARFETILPHEIQDSLLQQNDLWTKGLVRAESIIEARKRYKVDAIIFGKITQYRPYDPPILGIKIGMFSTVTGNVLWSSDAIFDSSEASVVQLIKRYHKNNFQKRQSLYDWKIILLSMKRYAQFVAHHIIATL
ncbi:MAG: hypothetical protein D8M57_02860 [Candidatus Scalindua sp. AMX11]|nr:MAG: hypothetical protein DWQ00_17130 [Candidatus Scalindua sp.]NOG85804.1 hypothetical protein [Planctomycetota bacterium]RZV97020.1 MAG: hypothetical protein EX341_02200 [Candidatus Scalindua sp. SCAELEC01]TDE66366.1 MAG: hypothetical protein D8M57_02860 [Candidatus Scalindua sp. AMX11]